MISNRQPVHTVYGGAHLFSAGLAKKLGETAIRTLSEYAPNASTLAHALTSEEFDTDLWKKVYDRVAKKLKAEAVEDFRIDFEDGYGNRPDEEEDGHARSAAEEVAKGMAENSLPPFIGIRIKSFSPPCIKRSLRTLKIFVTTLAKNSKKKLPANFVVTIPKVTCVDQIKRLCKELAALEKSTGLKAGSLKYEFMVETTLSILDEKGVCPLRSYAEAGKGRCVAAHFGTYDYTAGCDITAAHQHMNHPACDFAKEMMKVSLTPTGIWLSDGATNVMPVGPHKGNLNDSQKQENTAVVHRAWALSYRHVRHSLVGGFYQGWDLHPAQLPVRYATVYSFFLESLDSATERLKGFMDKAARATLLGDVFDDAATGQGLLNFFLRGLSCGAITLEEAQRTGLTLDDIQTRSFLAILERRK